MGRLYSFLSKVYGNSYNLLYFYIIVCVIAMFFIVLIIVSLIKNSKENKIIDNIDLDETADNTLKKEEVEISNQEAKENILSETMIFNNNLMTKEEIVQEKIREPEPKIEEANIDDFQLPKIETSVEMPVVEEPAVYIEKAEIKPSLDDEITSEVVETPVLDFNVEIKPSLEPVNLSSLELDETKVDKSDINYFHEDEGITTNDNVVVSNDELKERLAKLQETNEIEKEKPNEELENLMKAVGLEDTIVIPKLKDEESILGK